MIKRSLAAERVKVLARKRIAYERAKRQALACLQKGLPGTFVPAPRANLHDRESLR